jgi:hypothetical protein
LLRLRLLRGVRLLLLWWKALRLSGGVSLLGGVGSGDICGSLGDGSSNTSCGKLLGRRVSTEVYGEDAEVELGIGLALLQEEPSVLHNALHKAADGQGVHTEELIGDNILVPQLHTKLGRVLIGDGKLEDLVPGRIDVVVLDGGLVLLVLQLHDAVWVGLADPLGVGKVTSGANANVETAHDGRKLFLSR